MQGSCVVLLVCIKKDAVIKKKDNSMDLIHDLIIIGDRLTGLTAGTYAMRAAPKTIIIEKGIPGGQVSHTKAVENYPEIQAGVSFGPTGRWPHIACPRSHSGNGRHNS